MNNNPLTFRVAEILPHTPGVTVVLERPDKEGSHAHWRTQITAASQDAPILALLSLGENVAITPLSSGAAAIRIDGEILNSSPPQYLVEDDIYTKIQTWDHDLQELLDKAAGSGISIVPAKPAPADDHAQAKATDEGMPEPVHEKAGSL